VFTIVTRGSEGCLHQKLREIDAVMEMVDLKEYLYVTFGAIEKALV